MELRQIEYVVAVADTGSFTGAATSLYVTQPSLSLGIARLERELGVLLFDRVGRRVVLSPAGEAFLEPARRLLRDARTARAAAESVLGLQAGHLDLVALPTLAVDPLAATIGAFRRAHPGVVVRVAEPETVSEVLSRVRSGDSELGLTELPVDDAVLTATRLFEQEIVTVWPPRSRPGGDGRRVAVRELESVPLVTTPPGTSTRGLVDRAFRAAGIEPTVAVETGQREAILPLVDAGAGTTFLPEGVARLAGGRFVVRRLDPPLTRTIGVVSRAGPLSPAAGRFLELATG
jgi:DNA-binding transcriptional LysR family regulator